MRGLIICYSTTGNTRLVANTMAASMTEGGIETIVRDPVAEPKFNDMKKFDIIGFGAPTMAWKPAMGFNECMGLVPSSKKPKPCFVFCTHGGQPVNTLRIMAGMAAQKNYSAIGGLEVLSETNWPLSRQFGPSGIGPSAGRPNAHDIENVKSFSGGIVNRLQTSDLSPVKFSMRLDPLHIVGQVAKPKYLRQAMSRKKVNRKKCVQCAKCAQTCVMRAISLQPFPVFSKRCVGCWACYNVCPAGAIQTLLTMNRGVYRGPAA